MAVANNIMLFFFYACPNNVLFVISLEHRHKSSLVLNYYYVKYDHLPDHHSFYAGYQRLCVSVDVKQLRLTSLSQDTCGCRTVTNVDTNTIANAFGAKNVRK